MSHLARMLVAVTAALSLMVIAGPGAPGAVASSSPAVCAAGDPCGVPTCVPMAGTIGRPGIARQGKGYCERTDRVEVVGDAVGGTVEDLQYVLHQPSYQVAALGGLGWTFRPDADFSGIGGFTLRLSGPGGQRDFRVDVRVIPREENTPPKCWPVKHEQRTDGTAPATVGVSLSCTDSENDAFMLEASGGPGTHLSAPIPSGAGSKWRYRTAAAAGTETFTYRAVDEIGGRSADAPVSVTVGPGTDRPTRCWPQPQYLSGEPGVSAVYLRAGRVRQFDVHCEDSDGDPFTIEEVRDDDHGVLEVTDVLASSSTLFGTSKQVWLRYTPLLPVAEDRVSFVTVTNGKRVLQQLAMRVAAPTVQHGHECGTPATQVGAGREIAISVWCEDDDGDLLAVTVARQPEHGTIGPVLAPRSTISDGHGVTATYRPDADFVGIDCVVLRVTDEAGRVEEVRVDLQVRPEAPRPEPQPEPDPQPEPEPDPQPGPEPDPQPGPRPQPEPTLPTVTAPSSPSGVAAPTAPAPQPAPAPPAPAAAPVRAGSAASGAPHADRDPLADARRVLGVKDVVLVRSAGPLRVYAARTTLRRGVATRSGKPAFAVACAAASCTVSTRVRIGARAVGAAAAPTTVAPGRALPLQVVLGASERSMLARSPRARVAVTVVGGSPGSASRKVTVTLRVRS